MSYSHYTRLIYVTKNAEQLIVYLARVSNPQNQNNVETAPRLIKYLIKHQHWSPFEMADMCVEVRTSRAISAQILRHWSFSFQEFSQRYAEIDDKTQWPIYVARRQHPTNRQMSIDDLPQDVIDWFDNAQNQVINTCMSLYKQALDKGIAKEQARFLLPMSAPTTIYMKANIRDWIHYLTLRSDVNTTQREHANIAIDIIKNYFIPNFPSISEALGFTERFGNNINTTNDKNTSV